MFVKEHLPQCGVGDSFGLGRQRAVSALQPGVGSGVGCGGEHPADVSSISGR